MRTPTLALTGLMLAAAPAAFAQAENAGASLLETLNQVLTGNLMLAVGLLIAVIGLYVWLVKQETTAGILMIIGGVAITAAPALFRGTSTVVTPVVDSFGTEQDFSSTQVDSGR